MQGDCTGVQKIKHSMSIKLISCIMLRIVQDTQKSNMCDQWRINSEVKDVSNDYE